MYSCYPLSALQRSGALLQKARLRKDPDNTEQGQTAGGCKFQSFRLSLGGGQVAEWGGRVVQRPSGKLLLAPPLRALQSPPVRPVLVLFPKSCPQ